MPSDIKNWWCACVWSPQYATEPNLLQAHLGTEAAVLWPALHTCAAAHAIAGISLAAEPKCTGMHSKEGHAAGACVSVC